MWTDLGATLAHENGPGEDILGGAVKRNDSSSDTLYFKFHVDPLSDASTEEYFAAFQLFEGDNERLQAFDRPVLLLEARHDVAPAEKRQHRVCF